eukprot:1159613-Pelagomonas_calceolata.AAC.2
MHNTPAQYPLLAGVKGTHAQGLLPLTHAHYPCTIPPSGRGQGDPCTRPAPQRPPCWPCYRKLKEGYDVMIASEDKNRPYMLKCKGWGGVMSTNNPLQTCSSTALRASALARSLSWPTWRTTRREKGTECR